LAPPQAPPFAFFAMHLPVLSQKFPAVQSVSRTQDAAQAPAAHNA
jgi:hypothetical protein